MQTALQTVVDPASVGGVNVIFKASVVLSALNVNAAPAMFVSAQVSVSPVPAVINAVVEPTRLIVNVWYFAYASPVTMVVPLPTVVTTPEHFAVPVQIRLVAGRIA